VTKKEESHTIGRRNGTGLLEIGITTQVDRGEKTRIEWVSRHALLTFEIIPSFLHASARIICTSDINFNLGQEVAGISVSVYTPRLRKNCANISLLLVCQI